MIPIKGLLNKIKWSKTENPADYLLFYFDRIENKLKELSPTEIKRIEEGFLVLEKAGEEINIPLHRIRKVEKKGRAVWERA